MTENNQKALELYLKELQKLKEKYEKRYEKEKNKYAEKIAAFKMDYPNENSIDISFAVGAITYAKRCSLLKTLRSFNDFDNFSTPTGKMILMLESDIRSINIELEHKQTNFA